MGVRYLSASCTLSGFRHRGPELRAAHQRRFSCTEREEAGLDETTVFNFLLDLANTSKDPEGVVAACLGLEGEQSACEAAGIEFFSFPIKDRGLPRDAEAVSRLSRLAHARITGGCGWVFHCRAGIGRSGMMAASVLLQEGLTVHEAFARISAARGLTVPDTPGRLEWLGEHSATIAGKTSAPGGPVSE